ncbi:MAG: hypothetical protein KJ666_15800 [Bacteroidetes bacterium]|nr:hypothetical protein [Bacteroidota bacterium]
MKDMNLKSVGVFDAIGRDSLKNKNVRIESFFNIFNDRGAEIVFILSDLENDPCISFYKDQLYDYNLPLKIDIVAVKAIESWLLSDSITLSALLQRRFLYDDPENTQTLPLNELQEIFLEVTGRGLGIGYKKPRIMKKFIKNGFTLERAATHPNCSSVKYFLKKLKEFSEA